MQTSSPVQVDRSCRRSRQSNNRSSKVPNAAYSAQVRVPELHIFARLFASTEQQFPREMLVRLFQLVWETARLERNPFRVVDVPTPSHCCALEKRKHHQNRAAAIVCKVPGLYKALYVLQVVTPSRLVFFFLLQVAIVNDVLLLIITATSAGFKPYTWEEAVCSTFRMTTMTDGGDLLTPWDMPQASTGRVLEVLEMITNQERGLYGTLQR